MFIWPGSLDESQRYNIQGDSLNRNYTDLQIDITQFRNGTDLIFTGLTFQGQLSFIGDAETSFQSSPLIIENSSIIFQNCRVSLISPDLQNSLHLLGSSTFEVRDSVIVVATKDINLTPASFGLDLKIGGYSSSSSASASVSKIVISGCHVEYTDNHPTTGTTCGAAVIRIGSTFLPWMKETHDTLLQPSTSSTVSIGSLEITRNTFAIVSGVNASSVQHLLPFFILLPFQFEDGSPSSDNTILNISTILISDNNIHQAGTLSENSVPGTSNPDGQRFAVFDLFTPQLSHRLQITETFEFSRNHFFYNFTSQWQGLSVFSFSVLRIGSVIDVREEFLVRRNIVDIQYGPLFRQTRRNFFPLSPSYSSTSDDVDDILIPSASLEFPSSSSPADTLLLEQLDALGDAEKDSTELVVVHAESSIFLIVAFRSTINNIDLSNNKIYTEFLTFVGGLIFSFADLTVLGGFRVVDNDMMFLKCAGFNGILLSTGFDAFYRSYTEFGNGNNNNDPNIIREQHRSLNYSVESRFDKEIQYLHNRVQVARRNETHGQGDGLDAMWTEIHPLRINYLKSIIVDHNIFNFLIVKDTYGIRIQAQIHHYGDGGYVMTNNKIRMNFIRNSEVVLRRVVGDQELIQLHAISHEFRILNFTETKKFDISHNIINMTGDRGQVAASILLPGTNFGNATAINAEGFDPYLKHHGNISSTDFYHFNNTISIKKSFRAYATDLYFAAFVISQEYRNFEIGNFTVDNNKVELHSQSTCPRSGCVGVIFLITTRVDVNIAENQFSVGFMRVLRNDIRIHADAEASAVSMRFAGKFNVDIQFVPRLALLVDLFPVNVSGVDGVLIKNNNIQLSSAVSSSGFILALSGVLQRFPVLEFDENTLSATKTTAVDDDGNSFATGGSHAISIGCPSGEQRTYAYQAGSLDAFADVKTFCTRGAVINFIDKVSITNNNFQNDFSSVLMISSFIDFIGEVSLMNNHALGMDASFNQLREMKDTTTSQSQDFAVPILLDEDYYVKTPALPPSQMLTSSSARRVQKVTVKNSNFGMKTECGSSATVKPGPLIDKNNALLAAGRYEIGEIDISYVESVVTCKRNSLSSTSTNGDAKNPSIVAVSLRGAVSEETKNLFASSTSSSSFLHTKINISHVSIKIRTEQPNDDQHAVGVELLAFHDDDSVVRQQDTGNNENIRIGIKNVTVRKNRDATATSLSSSALLAPLTPSDLFFNSHYSGSSTATSLQTPTSISTLHVSCLIWNDMDINSIKQLIPRSSISNIESQTPRTISLSQQVQHPIITFDFCLLPQTFSRSLSPPLSNTTSQTESFSESNYEPPPRLMAQSIVSPPVAATLAVFSAMTFPSAAQNAFKVIAIGKLRLCWNESYRISELGFDENIFVMKIGVDGSKLDPILAEYRGAAIGNIIFVVAVAILFLLVAIIYFYWKRRSIIKRIQQKRKNKLAGIRNRSSKKRSNKNNFDDTMSLATSNNDDDDDDGGDFDLLSAFKTTRFPGLVAPVLIVVGLPSLMIGTVLVSVDGATMSEIGYAIPPLLLFGVLYGIFMLYCAKKCDGRYLGFLNNKPEDGIEGGVRMHKQNVKNNNNNNNNNQKDRHHRQHRRDENDNNNNNKDHQYHDDDEDEDGKEELVWTLDGFEAELKRRDEERTKHLAEKGYETQAEKRRRRDQSQYTTPHERSLKRQLDRRNLILEREKLLFANGAIALSIFTKIWRAIVKIFTWLLYEEKEWKETRFVLLYALAFDSYTIVFYGFVDFIVSAIISILAGVSMTCKGKACCQGVAITMTVFAFLHCAVTLWVRFFLMRIERWCCCILSVIVFVSVVLALLELNDIAEATAIIEIFTSMTIYLSYLAVVIGLQPILQGVFTIVWRVYKRKMRRGGGGRRSEDDMMMMDRYNNNGNNDGFDSSELDRNLIEMMEDNEMMNDEFGNELLGAHSMQKFRDQNRRRRQSAGNNNTFLKASSSTNQSYNSSSKYNNKNLLSQKQQDNLLTANLLSGITESTNKHQGSRSMTELERRKLLFGNDFDENEYFGNDHDRQRHRSNHSSHSPNRNNRNDDAIISPTRRNHHQQRNSSSLSPSPNRLNSSSPSMSPTKLHNRESSSHLHHHHHHHRGQDSRPLSPPLSSSRGYLGSDDDDGSAGDRRRRREGGSRHNNHLLNNSGSLSSPSPTRERSGSYLRSPPKSPSFRPTAVAASTSFHNNNNSSSIGDLNKSFSSARGRAGGGGSMKKSQIKSPHNLSLSLSSIPSDIMAMTFSNNSFSNGTITMPKASSPRIPSNNNSQQLKSPTMDQPLLSSSLSLNLLERSFTNISALMNNNSTTDIPQQHQMMNSSMTLSSLSPTGKTKNRVVTSPPGSPTKSRSSRQKQQDSPDEKRQRNQSSSPPSSPSHHQKQHRPVNIRASTSSPTRDPRRISSSHNQNLESSFSGRTPDESNNNSASRTRRQKNVVVG